MTTRRQFALVFVGAVALASLASHAAIRFVGVQFQPGQIREFGMGFHSTPMVAAGSSLISFGIDWDRVAKDFSRPIKILGVPAASPCELEVLQASVPETDFTIVAISVSDMDEDILSDFRARIVPVTQTWHDLRHSQTDEALARRTLGEYPLRYARILFPTAGRSVGVLVGIRELARQWMRRQAAPAAEPLPTFDTSAGFPTNRISDWDSGHVLRHIEQWRQECGGHHGFAGPKHLALERMLRWAAARGQVVVLVLPESATYEQKVIDVSVLQSFDASLADMARRVPAAKWIRLDQMAALHSDELYWDLVHPNADARALETAALLKQLEPLMRAP